MYKSVLAFTMQIAILLLIAKPVLSEPFYLGDRENHDERIINIVRYVVSILLHMNILPEVESAIALMKLAKDNH